MVNNTLHQIRSNWFPEIRLALAFNPNLFDTMQMSCRLCGEINCSKPLVLACGHVLGEKCFRRFSNDQEDNICPIDETPLTHDSCRCDAWEFPIESLDSISNIPTCIYEHKVMKRPPPRCIACQWEPVLFAVGCEFQYHIPNYLRQAIEYQVVFSLKLSSGGEINMDCYMQNMDDNEDERSYMDIAVEEAYRVYHPVEQHLVEYGEPSLTIDCPFLEICRPSLNNIPRTNNDLWVPRVLQVQVGLRTPRDEIADGILSELRECLGTMHTQSIQYAQFMEEVQRRFEAIWVAHADEQQRPARERRSERRERERQRRRESRHGHTLSESSGNTEGEGDAMDLGE